jgi:hypothetical protein
VRDYHHPVEGEAEVEVEIGLGDGKRNFKVSRGKETRE